MSEEKTLEELKAELESLKKQNLEREIGIERAKVEEAEKVEEEKNTEKIREEIRAELLTEMKADSTIVEEKPESIEEKKAYQELIQRFWSYYKIGDPSIKYVDEVAKTFRIRLEESRTAWEIPTINKRVCFLPSAFLAGQVQALLETQVNVFESRCLAQGYESCDFAGAVGLPFHKFDVLNKNEIHKIKNSIFETTGQLLDTLSV